MKMKSLSIIFIGGLLAAITSIPAMAAVETTIAPFSVVSIQGMSQGGTAFAVTIPDEESFDTIVITTDDTVGFAIAKKTIYVGLIGEGQSANVAYAYNIDAGDATINTATNIVLSQVDKIGKMGYLSGFG